ncbi:DUF2061 domain-containing protein [Prolixibacteraceae bacterium JC049]|nr:DUF2061 domain-containing protein [Prolixibacteraceae bacterium JC049]
MLNSTDLKNQSPNTTDPPKKISTVRDRPVKSIFKAITWRVIASATTWVLAWLFFQNDPLAVEKASGIALAESVLKIILYFLHERLWNTVRWGRMRVIIRRNSIIRRKIIKKIMLSSKSETD